MSTPVASSNNFPAAAASSGQFLMAGFGGLAVAAAGIFVSGARNVAHSYLVGFTFWTAIAIGMMMLVLIHHVFDASWSVLIRRQFEHGLASFKWLAVLFLPAPCDRTPCSP